MSNTRKTVAKESKDEFAKLASVILETRNSIIQNVRPSIPENHTGDIVFLIGDECSGNTTTFCFLRGDEMILEDRKYISLSDKSRLIRQSVYTVATLVPNIAIANGILLIDFPGLYYKNQQLRSELGSELALKALIAEYHPKILVVQSITSTSEAFIPIRNRGIELGRIVGNKAKACVLGLTQYQKDYDYDQLNGESVDIQDRVSRINKIKKREDTFLVCLGLQDLIRFDRLENPLASLGESQKRDTCLKTLQEFPGHAEVNAEQCLSYEDRGVLESVFTRSYIDDTADISNCDVFHSFELLNEAYAQGSLIKAVIGGDTAELLHLPEMEPGLVHKLDTKLINICVEHYERNILALGVYEITQFVTSLTQQNDVSAELKQQLQGLADIIKCMRGLHTREESLWIHHSCRNTYLLNDKYTEILFKLPSWTKALSFIPKNKPESIVILAKIVRDKKDESNVSDELLRQCTNDVSQLTHTLKHLLQIRKMVEDGNRLRLIAKNSSPQTSRPAYGTFKFQTNTSKEGRVQTPEDSRDKSTLHM